MANADAPHGDGGRQYHIGLAPGEVARSVILVGDPARARRASARFDRIDHEIAHREYVTFTGVMDGLELTLMATGMGCDNTEIALVELLNCERNPTLVRVGTCGGLQEDTRPGDLVVSTGAMRLENTSLGFVDPGFPAIAHHEVVTALLEACEAEGAPHRAGITATAPGFYGWQGRPGSVFTPLETDLPERLRRMGVANMEMETSTLLTLATLAGVRAGAICTVFAQRPRNLLLDPADRVPAEDRALHVAVSALRRLNPPATPPA